METSGDQLNIKSSICHAFMKQIAKSRSSERSPRATQTDTPQFRGGNPYFFSENPYQSVSFIYASMYRENVHAIHIEMQFAAKKSRHCVIKVDSQQQRTKTGALLHVARRSD